MGCLFGMLPGGMIIMSWDFFTLGIRSRTRRRSQATKGTMMNYTI